MPEIARPPAERQSSRQESQGQKQSARNGAISENYFVAELDSRCAPPDVISHRQIEGMFAELAHPVPKLYELRFSHPRQPPFIEIHSQESFDGVSVHLAFWLHL